VVTVLIPTAGRPALLRVALQSVAEQKAFAKIDRIFVSENGSEPGSRLVCTEFPQLPITYIYRDPAVKPLAHGRLLMNECLQGDITCILHDDDWWLPNHLGNALAALDADPAASAYGTSFIIFKDNTTLLERYDLTAWFGANYPATESVWKLSPSNVLLASFFGLVVHYSSLVARTEALAQSAFIYDLDNPFDNDRMLLYALSRHGAVLFNPEVSVVVRHHEARDTSNFEQDERNRRMAQTTEWMVSSGMKSWSLMASAFAKRLAGCPDQAQKIDLIRIATLRPWCLPEMARHLSREQDAEFFAMYDRAREMFASTAPQDDRR
jgi:glycosyltransferase involved in cell wall biosynthesis